jgi:molybdate transport system regulatory protein
VTRPTVRFRADFAALCSVGPGKISLLEGIQHTGSLSQAARELGMSYRRAWRLLASLNESFRESLVRTTTGGRGGVGAQLTPLGRGLISSCRAFEKETQMRAATAFKKISVKARKGSRGVRAASVTRLSRR